MRPPHAFRAGLPTLRRSLPARLRTTSVGLLVLALAVGAGAGLAAVAFHSLVRLLTLLFTGNGGFPGTGAGTGAGPVAGHGQPSPWFGPWFVVVVPALAGLAYGPLLYRFSRGARSEGLPEVMYAVARRGGRLPARIAAVRTLGSAVCIGGGSVGPEGPVAQVGSALGSVLGGSVRAAEDRMRVLVGCGTAGGIAATFNAPLAGVFFAMELVLRNFAAEAFGMVVLASVAATAVALAFLGDRTYLQLPDLHVEHGSDYALFALLGLLAGAAGVGFTQAFRLIGRGCSALWRGPQWARPAVGGLVLGALFLAVPQVFGIGDQAVEEALRGGYALPVLLLLMVAKTGATSLTIGIGGSGGAFAPSLFVGAAAGMAFGTAAHAVLPGVAGPAAVYGVLGMGAVFAGSARAPVTAVVIMLELTDEYAVLLPLMVAVVLATGVSRLLSADTVYTSSLRRRGVDVEGVRPAGAVTLGQVMASWPRPLALATHPAAAADRLAAQDVGTLPVADDDGTYVGVVTLQQAILAGHDAGDAATLAALTATPPVLTDTMTVDRALDALISRPGLDAVPVLNGSGLHPVGWLTRRALARALAPGRP
ncbi:MAG TPA: chloride channel protein [Streptomyces sp.]|nr:chloride channel protein [Streptomyces sp.]